MFNDDEVRYLDGTIFDVTDQQRAEDAIHKLNQDLERRVQERTVELRAAVAALRESEDRFRDLAESASDWFWEIGADLRVTYVSDRIREVAGVEPSSIIGVHVRDLPTVNHEDSDWNAYMDALEERRPFRGLICQRRVDDGSIRSFQFSGRPVFDNEGEFLGFRCVTTDLTARVRAEEALRQARDELEQRVEQRTAELKEANEQLKREIAEQKQAEDALRESEARYQAVVEDQTELISRHTPDGNRTFVNEAYCRFHGKSRDELIGRSAYEALAPEELDRLKALYARLTPEQPIGEFEISFPGPDGETAWQRWTKRAIFDASGCVTENQAVGRDITERKRAEEALRQSEKHLQRSVLDAPIPIMIHAEDGEVLMISQEWTSLTGYTHAEIPTISVWTELAYGSRGITDQSRERIGTLYGIEEKKSEGDYHITTKTGEHKIWDFRSSPLGKLPDGRRFVISMAMDVTERRLAHDELEQRVEERTSDLRRANRALRESEGWLKLITNNVPACISYFDREQRFRFANEKYESMLGWKPSELVGKTLEEVIGKKAYQIARQFVQQALCGQTVSFENTLPGKNGGKISIAVSYVPDIGPDRTVKGFFALVQDITERKRLEAKLLRQERLATLGQLTATVSHELRNPLGVIRTSTFVARDGMNGATPRVQRALERIDRSVIRCDRIIDELLDFTRISGLEPEPTPIDAWLDGTLKEQTLPAEITLRRDFGLADTTVPFDRDRFRRAIINVFDNACQAMTGEVGPEEAADADHSVLSVTTQRKNGRVEVIFEDRGPGIPADVLPRIFEPLFSTKGFGVGLGLPVVKRIMEQHGGGIEIDCAGTSGTRVCLWLPAERPTR